ncbi:hypothetical protein IFE17_02615 [Actinobacillus sp. GY-402]|nr:hypothetical protein IFE17_02615 [Actinobacillus sp. GY-402]
MLLINSQDNRFHNGDGRSEQGTIVTAEWLNAVQDEIAGVIKKFGGTINPENPNQMAELLAAYFEASSPVSTGYSPTRKYTAGELVFVDGNWYECYHPDGAKGKDPRDDINRPAGWATLDESQPYNWIKIGKWLQLPETGAVLNYQKTTLREGIIKYRNDANLHKDKFWRLAEVYPDLISGNYLTIADLRGEFLRMLDDGRNVDSNRAVGSAQGDAIRNIEAKWNNLIKSLSTGSTLSGSELVSEWRPTVAPQGGNLYSVRGGETAIYNEISLVLNAGKTVPTAAENRPRNVALLAATRI